MTQSTTRSSKAFSGLSAWTTCAAAIAVLLAALFYRSVLPGQVVFSNDGPLGILMAEAGQLPGQFTGYWMDLNWVGEEAPAASPNATSFLRLVLGNVGFAKFYPPICLFLLGLAAVFFSRRLGANWPAALLVGLAAALNGNVFSNTSWGLGTRALTLAAVFLALAIFTGPVASRLRGWMLVALAGAAVGLNLMEGYDVGAILSLYVAAYVLYTAWLGSGSPVSKLRQGVLQVVVVAVVAAWVATHTLSTLVGTQVTGRAGMEQTREAKQERWDWATQWSLPKLESLRVIVPGLFGYRMDTAGGGQYWGRVGQQPGWDKHQQGMPRHSGTGEYGGILVVLIALWGVAQGLRSRGSPFQPRERRLILFWTIAGGISLLLAFGRHAPFYQLLYGLPFFSTIRNPIKFMFPFHLSLLVLMAYGLIGMSRAYLGQGSAVLSPPLATLKRWWAGATTWEHKWVKGMLGVAAFILVVLIILAASRSNLERHLASAGFSAEQAVETSGHVLMEWLAFLVFFVLSGAVLTLIVGGVLRGPRVRWAWLGLGLILTVDLARANLPWIRFVDVPHKYASNPIVDILRQRPFEHRVQVLPFGGGPELEQLQQLYGIEWVQHLFPFYNVQSLDRVMEPRVAADNELYRAEFTSTNRSRVAGLLLRKWELTNTRYLLGLGGGFVDVLNQQLDPVHQRFRLHTPFALVPKREPAVQFEDVTARLQADGAFALIEFAGALPRYGLYRDWRPVTDDARTTLSILSDPEFDPHRTVLVEGLAAPPAAAAGSAGEAGTVELVSYHPKHLVFQAQVTQPSVLLLNDKYHPDWKVTVGGEPVPLLRGNFLMRAVHLLPGDHRVEFAYRPPTGALTVSLAGLGLALGLTGFLLVGRRRVD